MVAKAPHRRRRRDGGLRSSAISLARNARLRGPPTCTLQIYLYHRGYNCAGTGPAECKDTHICITLTRESVSRMQLDCFRVLTNPNLRASIWLAFGGVVEVPGQSSHRASRARKAVPQFTTTFFDKGAHMHAPSLVKSSTLTTGCTREAEEAAARARQGPAATLSSCPTQ